MKKILTIIALCFALVTPAYADGLPEEATYGVCFTGVDERFPDAVLGYAAPGAVVSSPPHWHGDGIHSLIGQCVVGDFVLHVGGHGGGDNEQHHVMIRHEVADQDTAMRNSGGAQGDNYAAGDTEQVGQNGCTDVGSTKASGSQGQKCDND